MKLKVEKKKSLKLKAKITNNEHKKGTNEQEWMENEVERRYLNKWRNLNSKPYLFQGWSTEMMMILERWRRWRFRREEERSGTSL